MSDKTWTGSRTGTGQENSKGSCTRDPGAFHTCTNELTYAPHEISMGNVFDGQEICMRTYNGSHGATKIYISRMSTKFNGLAWSSCAGRTIMIVLPGDQNVHFSYRTRIPGRTISIFQLQDVLQPYLVLHPLKMTFTHIDKRGIKITSICKQRRYTSWSSMAPDPHTSWQVPFLSPQRPDP